MAASNDLTWQGVEVQGVFLRSFAGACVNLRILAGEEAAVLAAAEPNGWYPADGFLLALSTLGERFHDFDPIKERIGVEMMQLWYDRGPGRTIVNKGVDFLHHQTGSQGYHGVVRGRAEAIGDFALERFDEAAGRARVRSTTPFDRTIERGVLLGGLRLAGDLSYVDVVNTPDSSVFEIEFH